MQMADYSECVRDSMLAAETREAEGAEQGHSCSRCNKRLSRVRHGEGGMVVEHGGPVGS